jgi:hypothetical protein
VYWCDVKRWIVDVEEFIFSFLGLQQLTAILF